MATADVTVMGAGIFGLSVAFTCAARGARVAVADPWGIGAGASGGVLGALAPHTPEGWTATKAVQRDSLLMAAEHWGRVAALAGVDPGYARLGRLQPVSDDRALARARARAEAAAGLWRGQAVWRVVPAAEHPAWAPASPTGWLIHDTLSARLHPQRACAALAGAVRALGGRVATEAPERPGPVVWATGHSGLAALSDDLGRPVGVGVKGQAALLRLDAGTRPQIFAHGMHVVGHDDATVAVGSTSERDVAHADTTGAALDALLARARAAVPALHDAPVMARWAGVRPRAASRVPLLGPWPGRPAHFVANGGFKIGFGMAPAVGEMMADLVLDGRDGLPDAFRLRPAA